MKLKRAVIDGGVDKKAVNNAPTKPALVALAEAHSVSLEPLLAQYGEAPAGAAASSSNGPSNGAPPAKSPPPSSGEAAPARPPPVPPKPAEVASRVPTRRESGSTPPPHPARRESAADKEMREKSAKMSAELTALRNKVARHEAEAAAASEAERKQVEARLRAKAGEHQALRGLAGAQRTAAQLQAAARPSNRYTIGDTLWMSIHGVAWWWQADAEAAEREAARRIASGESTFAAERAAVLAAAEREKEAALQKV